MATVNIETRSSYGELVKGVGVQFLDVFNQSQNSYSLAMDDMIAQEGNKMTALAKQVTTDQAVVHYIQKTGVSFLQVTPEGAAFNSDSRILGYKTSVTPQKFTQSVSVSYEAMQDRSYDDKLDEFSDLGVSGKETMDKAFFDMFNLAFTAQSSLPNYIVGYGDAKPLCSISHPRKDGGAVQLNTFSAATTQLPYSETNQESARVFLSRQLDDRGKLTRVGGGKLILLIPTELEKQAIIINQSQKRAGTANNDINIYDGVVTVISSKYIGYSGNPGSLPSTAWFLIDPRAAKLMFVLREGLATHTFKDPNSLGMTFYIRARFAVCWADWRGVFGSLGDSSAYAS